MSMTTQQLGMIRGAIRYELIDRGLLPPALAADPAVCDCDFVIRATATDPRYQRANLPQVVVPFCQAAAGDAISRRDAEDIAYEVLQRHLDERGLLHA